MILVYDFMVFLYSLAVRIAALGGNRKAKLWISGRKGWKQRVADEFISGSPSIWVHCSSLGEFEQGRPLMEEIKARFPHHVLVLTFFSPSGYEVRKNYPVANHIWYLPVDTRRNARFFLDKVRPEQVFFIKYEFWWHYLAEMKKRAIPAYLVSAHFRDEQAFFRPYAGWYRKFLACFTHIFVQDERSVVLLHDAGIRSATITGDTRFDRVCRIADNSADFPRIATFKGSSLCIVVGSSWTPDEELLIRFMRERAFDIKWIIAPHEVHENNIQRLMEALPLSSVRYTRLDAPDSSGADVLIIDTMGMLSSIYKYGDIAYIGGGFGKGIHNILEAAAFSIPVLFGPNYYKFQEAKGLIAARGAYTVDGYPALRRILENMLNDHEARREAGKISGNFVASGRGATKKIMDQVFS